MVDAELGILLRVSWMTSTQEHEVTELVRLELNPVIDPAQFAPPPGSRIGESLGASLSGGAAWYVMKTAAGLAAGGLGAWIRYSPIGRGQRGATGDAGEAISPDEPAPGLPPDGLPAGPQVSDEILHLLQGSGTSGFAATRHQWLDFPALLSQVPPGGPPRRLRRPRPARRLDQRTAVGHPPGLRGPHRRP